MDEEECPELVSARVPVTILTGFLGSGKTTLLHYVLSAEHQLKIAVIVNEFEFGKSIEKGLTVKSSEKSDDEWVELKNGCMCCSAQTQTISALEALIARKGTFDLILVETAGLADPAPVASMFWQDEALCGLLYLSGVVTLVDAVNICRYLADGDVSSEATRQILVADKVVLNKCDVASYEQQTSATNAIACINPVAQIIRSSHAQIDDLRSILFIDTTRNMSDLTLPHVHRDGAPLALTALSIEFSALPRVLAIRGTQEADRIFADLLYSCPETHTSSRSRGAHENVRAHSTSTKICKSEKYEEELPSIESAPNDTNGDMDAMCTEVVRCKAAVWMYHNGAFQLLQMQSIGELFDVRVMEGASVPLGCSRVLVLGKNIKEDWVRRVFMRYLVPVDDAVL